VLPAPDCFNVTPTRFELELCRLGLNNPQEWHNSESLEIWVERNRKTRYVPEALLEAWNLQVYERDIKLWMDL
jgi:hypothetical protein